jgi:hypothetical protein
LLGTGCGWAQQALPKNDTPTTTLHVYTNLAQVPTLVLTKRHEEMTPVPPAQFRRSLDSGPAVPPTHERVEGDDPISMAILIDTMVPKSELLPQVQEAVTGLARGSLGPGRSSKCCSGNRLAMPRGVLKIVVRSRGQFSR